MADDAEGPECVLSVCYGADSLVALLCHWMIHPVYARLGGHLVGHHVHSRVETSVVDVHVYMTVMGGSMCENGDCHC